MATDVPFSAASKRVFEAAVEFSRNMGCNFISPEHIALGLFDLDDPTTNRILKRLVLIFCSILLSIKKLSAIFLRFWSMVYHNNMAN